MKQNSKAASISKNQNSMILQFSTIQFSEHDKLRVNTF